MELSKLERFAVSMLFRGSDPFCAAVREGIDAAVVVDRKLTGVGFFATIRLAKPLPADSLQEQWDWNFSHRELSHGGSFMGWREDSDVIGLEAMPVA